MNIFVKFLQVLSAEMTDPHSYGWFHFMFVGIMISLTAFLCIKFRNSNDKVFRRIVLIAWITMLVLEIYKQFEFSYDFVTNDLNEISVTWDYNWEAFPYQLCSTPLYVFPFIAFMKDNKFREYLVAYVSTFSLFGGLATFCYPENVFIETIGINIQTMVHHGLQIVIGVFCIVYFRKRFNIKFYLKSLPVFGVLVSIAFFANEIFYAIVGDAETFNMFYISRHWRCILPILEIIYDNIHYVPFLMLYVFGFMLVAAIIFFVAKGIMVLVNKIKAKKRYA